MVGALVLTVTLSACWEQSGFDAGHSGWSWLPVNTTPSNVGSLARAFGAPAGLQSSGSGAVVSGGHLFVSGVRLLAYDATGQSGCSGLAPAACTPLWSSAEASTFGSDLVVGGGKVWGLTGDTLLGYDAAGVNGCGGTPRICSPVVHIVPGTEFLGGLRWAGNAIHVMGSVGSSRTGFHAWQFAYEPDGNLRWQADLGVSSIPYGVGSVAEGGVLFVIGHSVRASAYDLAGVTGCSGTPKTCVPMWYYDGGGAMMARASQFFTAFQGHLGSYDARGVNGCSGTPKVCEPQWSTSGLPGPSVVDGDHAFVMHKEGTDVYSLGGTGCSGIPRVCSPLWSNAPTGQPYTITGASIAGGVIYTTTFLCPGGNCSGTPEVRVDAHSASGNVGCSGTPRVCTPLWTAAFPFAVGETMIVGDFVYVVGQYQLGPTTPDPEVRVFRAQ